MEVRNGNHKIKEIIGDLNRNICLPPIQRKFVWKTKQIEDLFDSILKGYPIGMFVFWKIRMNDNNNNASLTFYKFIGNYNKNILNNVFSPLNSEFTSILDGQQRLSSLYIALQGSYNGEELYLNLFNIPENNDKDYEFKFLTATGANNSNNDHLWFRVKDILTWNDGGASSYVFKLARNHPNLKEERISRIANVLGNLYNKISTVDMISSCEIDGGAIDDVLEIFTRINNGGTELTKSDLIFSIISSQWNNGRQEIENLLNEINGIGRGLGFNMDFIIRSIFFLSGLPISSRISKLINSKFVSQICKNWEKIKASVIGATNLIAEFGFDNKILTSKMAVIPIAHYLYKRGINYTLNGNDISDEKQREKQRIKSYLLRSLLKQIYGGHTDSLLTKIRRVIDNNFQNGFPLDELIRADLGGDKTLKITSEDMDTMLRYKYSNNSEYTFMVLSFLYPKLNLQLNTFHQDHIHPKSFFTRDRLRKLGLEDKFDDWNNKKDMIPNLQLLLGLVNQQKNNTPFKEWLNKKYSDIQKRQRFLERNFIPSNIDLSINNFDKFFEERRKMLKNKLIEILGVTDEKGHETHNGISDSYNTDKNEKDSNTTRTERQSKRKNGIDYTGKRVSAFIFKGTKYEVSRWEDVLLEICKNVLSNPNKSNNAKDITKLNLTKKRFSRNPKELKNPKKIESSTDEIYVDVDGLSANYSVSLSKKVLKYFGYNPEKDFQIETKDS